MNRHDGHATAVTKERKFFKVTIDSIDALLKRAACFLPIDFPQRYGLFAILYSDGFAGVKFVTAARRFRRCIADQDLATLRIRLQA